ncbi:MAG: DEAD/DEAH box helicase [Clostridiaceae bacterium]|jgi:ATP-dependent RNA helicase RhlE|nr:DEAD/DEAH box helicase [Clostridiaceae bacterium]
MQFKQLNIIPEILKALEQENYSIPTPIQEKAIPIILGGRDMLGCAQTGTGKTAAFAIPTLQLLRKTQQSTSRTRMIGALILTPTRELAIQIYESTRAYGVYTGLESCVVYGGVSQKPQEENLKRGVDILVATPGRLLDLINQKLIDLRQIKILILDEADRMLDMGFIHDVRKITAYTPEDKQTLLFSATMPEDIAKLSRDLLKNPARVDITPVSSTVESTEQYMYYVDKANKKHLLTHLLQGDSIDSALVFTRTKHGANSVVKHLLQNDVEAQAIHGNKSQRARQNALNDFKNGNLRVLVATDIASRGIDIEELSHVINFDLPEIPETYVHRIGRTGRAGLSGIAISFCNFDEKSLLPNIEKLIDKQLVEIENHPFPLMDNFPAVKAVRPARNSSANSSSSRAGKSAGKTRQSRPDGSVNRKRTSYNRERTRTAKSWAGQPRK